MCTTPYLGISRDGSKNFNIHTCEHMILCQLRIGARQAKNAPLGMPPQPFILRKCSKTVRMYGSCYLSRPQVESWVLEGTGPYTIFSNTIWVFDCIRQNADKSFVRGLVACMWKVGSDRCPVSFPVCAPPPLEAGEGGRGEGWHEQRKRDFLALHLATF